MLKFFLDLRHGGRSMHSRVSTGISPQAASPQLPLRQFLKRRFLRMRKSIESGKYFTSFVKFLIVY